MRLRCYSIAIVRRFVIIFILIVLPAHGQEKGGKSEKKPNEPQQIIPRAPTTPLVVVNQQTTNQNQGRATNQPEGYLHHLVLPETLAQLGLLIAGIVGICVAIHTLTTLQRQALIMVQQTRAMMRQAKANEDTLAQAKISSDVLANIERAWVDVRLVRHTGNNLYTVEITNHGRTVAYVQKIVIESTFTEGNDSPKPAVVTMHGKSKLLVPNQPWPAILINLDGDLGNEVFQKLMKGKARIDYHIVVHYAGIKPDCQSECLYFWEHSNGFGRLTPIEAPKYNLHT